MNYYPVGKAPKQVFKTIVTNLFTDFFEPPYAFADGCAVALNDEIHVLGSTAGKRHHYKWDGTKWTSVSTLPYDFNYGSAVVYDDEIHILGGYGKKNHYKWDGTEWTSVSTLPVYSSQYTSVVVYCDEIHLMNGYSDKYHYKWDGNTWTQLDDTPFVGAAVSTVCDNELHLIGGSGGNHYKWDGNTWTHVGSLPFGFTDTNNIYATVMNNLIYLCKDSSRIRFNGTSWDNLNKFRVYGNGGWYDSNNYAPHPINRSPCVTLSDGIHIIGRSDSSNSYPLHGLEFINLCVPI